MRALKVSYSDVGEGGVAVNREKTQFFLNTLYINEITKFGANIKYEEDLRDLHLWSALRLWSGAPTGARTCFWLISPKWLTFQAKDMHIRK